MSVQEEKLRAIADAIREKDGTEGAIPAKDFPERIRAIPTGGGLPEDLVTISVEVDPPEGGTVSGGGMASKGMTVTLRAEPADLFIFSDWRENGETVSTEAEYTFTVDGGRDLLAVLKDTRGSRLPEGYTELEYIISNSAAYIDSGLRPTATLKTYIDIGFVDKENAASIQLVESYYSATVSGTAYIFAYRLTYYNSKKKFQVILGRVKNSVGINSAAITITPPSETNRFLIGLNTASKTFEINGESATNTNSNASPTFHASMPTIALIKGASTSAIKYYSAQMYSGTTLSRDFIPCTKPDGEVGMYDLVGKKFYGSATASYSFTAGPAL